MIPCNGVCLTPELQESLRKGFQTPVKLRPLPERNDLCAWRRLLVRGCRSLWQQPQARCPKTHAVWIYSLWRWLLQQGYAVELPSFRLLLSALCQQGGCILYAVGQKYLPPRGRLPRLQDDFEWSYQGTRYHAIWITSIGPMQKSLLEALQARFGERPFTLAEAAVAAWQAAAQNFSLDGFPQYPDIRKVATLVYGRRGLLHKGLLTKVGATHYQIAAVPALATPQETPQERTATPRLSPGQV
jgi:hypothetical protein